MATKSTEEFENIRKEAYKICHEFLDETWNKLPISEFQFSAIRGGFSNTLYRCALPDACVVENPETPRQVLLRIYGSMQEDLDTIAKEVACFLILGEKKLGPKLYGIFPKGRLEEYIPSRNLLSKDFKLMHPAIPRKMAKIHALKVPLRRVPDFWLNRCKKWLNDIVIDLEQKKKGPFQYLNLYTEAMEWISEEMKKSNSPVVFCHNDLHGGNILLHDDSPLVEDQKITLIDFELASYNYRGFDIGNYFTEWCFQYKAEPPYFEYNSKNFPTEAEQISFITAYLDQLVKEGVTPPSSIEDEVKAILKEIDLFSMASYLMWSLWCWKDTFSETMDLREHGLVNINAFRAIRKKYTNYIYS